MRKVGKDGRKQLNLIGIIHEGRDELKDSKEHWNAVKGTANEATEGTL